MQVGRQVPGEGKGARFKGYSSTAACVRHLVRTEGLLGLTRGVGATMLRETPGNAIFFLRRAGLSAYGAWLHLEKPSSADAKTLFVNLLVYVHAPNICGDVHRLSPAYYISRMLQDVMHSNKLCQCVCSYEGLRKVVPGRPASSCERRGALALLSDAASSIVCGGAAGMIMWSVVPPGLHASALCSSVLLGVFGREKEGCSQNSYMCPEAQLHVSRSTA